MTDIIEQEIIEKFRQLAPSAKQHVLDFIGQIAQERPLSAIELMKLPPEVRQKHIAMTLDSAVDEDFEMFEAYSEEDMN